MKKSRNAGNGDVEKMSRPPVQMKPVKCRICGDDIMFPYARYENEGGDDWICRRDCDKAYQDLREQAHRAARNAPKDTG